MKSQMKGCIGQGLEGPSSTGASVSMELGCTIVLTHRRAQQLRSSPNLIVQDFYGGFITWARLIKILAIAD